MKSEDVYWSIISLISLLSATLYDARQNFKFVSCLCKCFNIHFEINVCSLCSEQGSICTKLHLWVMIILLHNFITLQFTTITVTNSQHFHVDGHHLTINKTRTVKFDLQTTTTTTFNKTATDELTCVWNLATTFFKQKVSNRAFASSVQPI